MNMRATPVQPRHSRFDGVTIGRVDEPRLTTQVGLVYAALTRMTHPGWCTLADLERSLGYQASQASISARLRDLRKARFGGHTIERVRDKDDSGLWLYRMPPPFKPLLDGKDRSLDDPVASIPCPHCDGRGRLFRSPDGAYDRKAGA